MAENKPLTLEDIPSYRRPMGATRVLGEMDEFGNPMYRMPSGRKFTVMEMVGEEAQEQQEMDRWPLGKVANDVREGVWEYMKNPLLPSWSQLKNLPSAIVQGMAQEIHEGATMPTPANILGLSAGVGAASVVAPAPRGALRVFGGRNAQGMDDITDETVLEAFNQHDRTMFQGFDDPSFDTTDINDLTPDEIYRNTGFFRGPDDQWRFEIPIEDANWTNLMAKENLEELRRMVWEGIDGENLTEQELIEQAQSGRPFEINVPLEEILDHPSLYAAYPQLRDMDLTLAHAPQEGHRGSFYDAAQFGYPRIELNLAEFEVPDDLYDTDTMMVTLYHEIQHAIQEIEGFDAGSNPVMISQAESSPERIMEVVEETLKRVSFGRHLVSKYGEGSSLIGRYALWEEVPSSQGAGLSAEELRNRGIVENFVDGRIVYEQMKMKIVIKTSGGRVVLEDLDERTVEASRGVDYVGKVSDLTDSFREMVGKDRIRTFTLPNGEEVF